MRVKHPVGVRWRPEVVGVVLIDESVGHAWQVQQLGIERSGRGERWVLKAQVSLLQKFFVSLFVFAALLFGLSIVLLPVTAALMLYAYLKIRSTEMGITSKRVIRKSGVVMRDTAEIRLSKVESVSVKQGFLGRIFGYGDVVIAGTGGNGAVMKGVADPLVFRGQVQEAFEHAQRISPGVDIQFPMGGITEAEIVEAIRIQLAARGAQ
jgi:membrane protein YdbS with pleckstrin-like domain